MQVDVWTSLGLAASATEVSQPVSMKDSNALSLTLVVFSGSLAATGVDIQESNDLENWKSKVTVFGSQGVGAAMALSVTGIASAYVRFKANGGAAATTLAMVVNTAKL